MCSSVPAVDPGVQEFNCVRVGLIPLKKISQMQVEPCTKGSIQTFSLLYDATKNLCFSQFFLYLCYKIAFTKLQDFEFTGRTQGRGQDRLGFDALASVENLERII